MRTPLNIINGALDGVSLDLLPSHLTLLTNNFINLNKLQNGEMQVNKEVFNLVGLVDKVVKSFDKQFDVKGNKLFFDFDLSK